MGDGLPHPQWPLNRITSTLTAVLLQVAPCPPLSSGLHCCTSSVQCLCLQLQQPPLSHASPHRAQSGAAAAGGGLNFGSGLGPVVPLPHMNGATPGASLYASQDDSTGHLLHHQMPAHTMPHQQVPVCHLSVWHTCLLCLGHPGVGAPASVAAHPSSGQWV